MLGKTIALAAAVALTASCVKNVKQDAHSGEDAKVGGAKALILDPQLNEAEGKGIVTYPGGDRVDWRSIELPAGKKGKVAIELSWKPPRPGLDLAFIVYDQYGQKIGSVKEKKPSAEKKAKKKKKRLKKSTEIMPVAGTIFIEVYATNRGSAGAYKLNVKWEEMIVEEGPKMPDPSQLQVPMPPKIAAVYPECDIMNIDPKNPDCKGKHPPCPEPPDPANPNCSGKSAKCDPNLLDPLNPNCLPYYPDCDPLKIDPKNPKCKGVEAPPAEPIAAEITDTETSGTGTMITINVGSKDGVTKDWKGVIIDTSGKGIENGSFTIWKIKDHACYAKVKVSKSVVDKNPAVRLTPPK